MRARKLKFDKSLRRIGQELNFYKFVVTLTGRDAQTTLGENGARDAPCVRTAVVGPASNAC